MPPCTHPGMKVYVDMLNPTIDAVKTNWAQLLEPVREVAPFAGACGRGRAGIRGALGLCRCVCAQR